MAIAVTALAGTAATPASAAVNSCGNGRRVHRVRIVNVTSINVGCPTSRRFAFDFETKSGPESDFRCSEDFNCTWRGYRCRNDGRRPRRIDHRCVRGSKVVRWQMYF